MSTINIKGLDKAEVLQALYNASKLQGMGFLQAKSDTLNIEQCRELLTKSQGFDYLYGKVMKVDLREDELHIRLYDRDNGEGAAARALEPLFKKDQALN